MHNEICSRDACTGCSACAQSCPKQCISMFPDEEGFLRPVINEDKCVNCGKCRKVCSAVHPIEDDGILPRAFAAAHLDDEIRNISSSGGMFSAFSAAVLERGGAIIAAGFDEHFRVIHKVCTCEETLNELRRSKYVQSDINGMYQEARRRLESGQIVLFCGTPCQIGGLFAFLGKEYPNLYSVDFICHGVPSPKLWEKYLNFREKKVNARVTDVSFRNKITGWKNYSMRIWFENGGEYCGTVSRDYYLRSFIMDMDLRPSCYQCRFKQLHRQADITLADFWGIREAAPSLADDKGMSLVLVHSEKGTELMELVRDTVRWSEVDCDKALQSNPSVTMSVSRPGLRKRFMKDANRLPFDKLYEKYCGTGLTAKVRRKLASLYRYEVLNGREQNQ